MTIPDFDTWSLNPTFLFFDHRLCEAKELRVGEINVIVLSSS
jgi:hypothetical protein